MKALNINRRQILRAIKLALIALLWGALPNATFAGPPTVSPPNSFVVTSTGSGFYKVAGVPGGSTSSAYVAGPANTSNTYFVTINPYVDLGNTSTANDGAVISIGADGGKLFLDNRGTLSGYYDCLATASGTTASYANSGTLSASSSESTYALSGDTIKLVANFGSGKILSTSQSASAYGIEATLLDCVSNCGLISAKTLGTTGSSYGIAMSATTINNATNFGKTSGSGYTGVGIFADTIQTSTNSYHGLVAGVGSQLSSASDYGAGYGMLANTILQSEFNGGTITGSGYKGFGVRATSIGTLDNFDTGDIAGVGSSSGYGLGVGVLASSGPLSTLNNRGKITGSGVYGIGVEGYTIGLLTNVGIIRGMGTTGYGIYSGGYANITLRSGTVSGATDAMLLDNEPNGVLNPQTGAESSTVTVDGEADIKGPIVEANGTGKLYLNLIGGTPAQAAIIRNDAGKTSGDVFFGGHEYSWSGLKLIPHVVP